MTELTIRHVDRASVTEVWPHLQRAFRRAQTSALGDRVDEVAIVKGLCEGKNELLVAERGSDVMGGIIIQFVARPKGKCCIVVASLFNEFPKRDFPDWAAAMNEHLADYAKRECECYTVEAFARDGVRPALEKLGWRRKATVMEMV